jgi:hypothetical protein
MQGVAGQELPMVFDKVLEQVERLGFNGDGDACPQEGVGHLLNFIGIKSVTHTDVLAAWAGSHQQQRAQAKIRHAEQSGKGQEKNEKQ